MFRRILVANRGEIAVRVLRTARELGIEVVAVCSEADRDALHVRMADHAVVLGGPAPADSYLRTDRILDAAAATGAEAIHPGYGFLAENAGFADAVRDAGLVFVGPSGDAIRRMGDKIAAREAAAAADVPVVPGINQEGADAEALVRFAREIGFPVMLKAAAGGGGKGIRIVRDEKELAEAAKLASAEARGAFGDGRVYLEKFVTRPRHVEVQILADRHGKVVSYGERECSVQRRHQKLVEETPCAALTEATRADMCEAARRVTAAIGYEGAGTVEFLFSEGEFYFLEMNTRLQVEHAITEEVYGVDLVAEQLRVASGEAANDPGEARGAAIEVRINAEDPATFFPSLGTIERLRLPGGLGVRVDSALYPGLEVTPYYDSMLAKLIVWAPTRDAAISKMLRSLGELRIAGVMTSVPVAAKALRSEPFRSGDYDTGILEKIADQPGIAASLDSDIAAIAAAFAKAGGLLARGSASPTSNANGNAAEGVRPWVLGARRGGMR
ncbi:MAG: acetyl-CoA carboxylase biotin carboxylase subunit [Planctomycetes bacterium]|nr:acetyl-CoA carboxylase biotin carboxylase subunit [Planctomycetota bacterium]